MSFSLSKICYHPTVSDEIILLAAKLAAFYKDPFCLASLVILAYLIKRCAIRDGESQFSLLLQLFYIIISPVQLSLILARFDLTENLLLTLKRPRGGGIKTQPV